MPTQLVTANRLTDGAVIFLRPDRTWSDKLGDAWLAGDNAEADAMLQSAERAAPLDGVVGPYLAEAEVRNGHAVPKRVREIIRVEGPSTHPEFRKS